MMLFVYGTLKRDFGNHRLLGDSQFLGEASTEGQLYSAGIPYMKHGPGQVQGEVYIVSDETLRRLDRLEGHPNWYLRQPCKAELFSNGRQLDVEAYFMDKIPEGAKRIESGIFGNKQAD